VELSCFFAALVLFEVAAHLATDHNRENTLDKIGLVCFAIAVIAEICAYPYSRRNDEFSGLEIASLNIDASAARLETETLKLQIARANERADEAEATVAAANAASHEAVARVVTAEARIAEANARAAEANRVAEGERLARIKIEEKIANRHLTVEQQRTLAAKLKRFAGQRLNMFAFANDNEIIGIANDILGALNPPDGANWIVARTLGQECGLTVPGIGIEVQRGADLKSVQAAAALLKALTDERLSASYLQALPPGESRGGAYSGDPDDKAMIRIIIGKKP
jgi:hypothetical protein